MIRPGRDQIAAGACPGGLIVQVYDLEGSLIFERQLDSVATAERTATIDAGYAASQSADVIVVIFDGDTGRRWSANEIARAFR